MSTYTGWHFTAGQHHGRDGWPLQKVEQLPKDTQPVLCEVGLHASKSALAALSYAQGPWVSRVRLEGTVVVGDDKACATRRARLAGPIDASRELRLFAADCAERVLPFFERRYPSDDRPRQAIDTARRFANGTASEEELGDARAAAWAAAWDAAWAAGAAWDADWDAAWAASWASRDAWEARGARAAAWEARAAWDAAWAAAWASRDARAAWAAWAAAWEAAWEARAAGAAAWEARAARAAWDAGDPELEWQEHALIRHLEEALRERA